MTKCIELHRSSMLYSVLRSMTSLAFFMETISVFSSNPIASKVNNQRQPRIPDKDVLVVNNTAADPRILS